MSKKVVLDPGHGENTPGKRSPDGTYFEHEFNLDMAWRMKDILERHGVAVTLTRTDGTDISNTARADISNKVRPHLFVSIHSNAAGSGADWMSARGYGIYTSVADDAAKRNIAAKKVLERVRQAGVPLWGSGLHHSPFTVLTATLDPAILIEHLFHDNREDVALLKSGEWRRSMAETDCRGILDYLGIPWQEEQGEPQTLKCPHCGGAMTVTKGVEV